MNKILILLIAVNAIITYKGLNDNLFFNRYKFNVGAIEKGEKIRFLTSGFLHADWMHFFFNMLSLYFFAEVVIHFLGLTPFMIVYFGGLLLGNYLSFMLYKNNKNYSAVGASGAVLSVIYASILLQPFSTIYLYFFIQMPAYIFGILYLLYSIYGMNKNNDGIGHSAHLGGAFAGYVCVCLLSFHSVINHFYIAILLLIPFILVYFKNKELINRK